MFRILTIHPIGQRVFDTREQAEYAAETWGLASNGPRMIYEVPAPPPAWGVQTDASVPAVPAP